MEAVAVVVGERQLRAGVRALTPDDQPGALGPAGQIDVLGDLSDLAVLALASRPGRAREPKHARDFEDRGADRVGQVVAEREAQLPLTAVVGQVVRGAGGVCAHQDLDALDVLGRDLLKRPVEHRHVVGGGVRAGVPRPEHRAERLPGLISVGVQRVKPVAALVVAGRLPSFSECAVISVASMSIVKDSGAPCNSQNRPRARACAERNASNSPGSDATRSTTRNAVESDATAPNSAS